MNIVFLESTCLGHVWNGLNSNEYSEIYIEIDDFLPGTYRIFSAQPNTYL